MHTDLSPWLRHCLEATVAELSEELLYHRVWQLLETLIPASALIAIHGPSKDLH